MNKMEMAMPAKEAAEKYELREEEIANILSRELDFFEIPEALRDRAGEAVEVDDFLFQTSDLLSDDAPRKPEELPVKIYHSKEWTSPMEKDTNYSHPAVYWADMAALSREYLPDDMAQFLNKKYESLKEKYPLLLINEKEKNDLWEKVHKRTATKEEREIFNKQGEQFEMFSREYENYRKALILKSGKIEKKIILLKNPLIIRGYKYEGEKTFERSEFGMGDIRYLSPEEISNLKKQGYDGIVSEQLNWVILFKD